MTIKLACLLPLAATACALDEPPSTSVAESDLSASQWADDVKIPNQASPYQVGVAWFGNRLHVVYRDDASHAIAWTKFDGSTWSSPKLQQLLSADYGPALVAFGGKLVALYHATGQPFLDMSTSDGSTWSTPTTAGRPLDGATVRYAPSMAVLGQLLYAAYCVRTSSGDRVRVDYYYTTWHPVAELPVPGECKHVALGARSDSKLELIVTEVLDGTWYMEEAIGSSNGGTWPTHFDLMTMRSKKPPSILTCNGTTHLVHGGYSTPDEIWWSYLRSDGTWSTNQKVANQASDGGATLGCFGGTRTMMVHDGGYTQLWWSQFLE